MDLAAINLELLYRKYKDRIDWIPVVFAGLTLIDLASENIENVFCKLSGNM